MVETSISLPTSAFDAADAGRGVFVPPAGEPIERGGEIGFALGVVERGGFGPGAGAQIENLLDELDEVIDAEIADRVFDRREQAEVAAEADDVPRVDQSAAFDAALQQVFDFGQVLGDGIELVGVDRLMAGGEQAINLAQHAGRRDAHAVGFGQRGFGVAHAGVELREMHVLHLDGAAAGQLVIQDVGERRRTVAACAAIRLAGDRRAGRSCGPAGLRKTDRDRRRCAAAGSRA